MKEKNIAIILALLLGGLGVHKFYLGKNFQGLVYLFFCWTLIPAIIGLIEGVCFMTYSTDRWNADFNKNSTGYSQAGPGIGDKDKELFEPKKKCPDCAETILAAARKCKHCGSQVSA